MNMGKSLRAGGGSLEIDTQGLESCTPGCIKKARIK